MRGRSGSASPDVLSVLANGHGSTTVGCEQLRLVGGSLRVPLRILGFLGEQCCRTGQLAISTGGQDGADAVVLANLCGGERGVAAVSVAAQELDKDVDHSGFGQLVEASTVSIAGIEGTLLGNSGHLCLQ